jgi:hypothetical protein
VSRTRDEIVPHDLVPPSTHTEILLLGTDWSAVDLSNLEPLDFTPSTQGILPSSPTCPSWPSSTASTTISLPSPCSNPYDRPPSPSYADIIAGDDPERRPRRRASTRPKPSSTAKRTLSERPRSTAARATSYAATRQAHVKGEQGPRLAQFLPAVVAATVASMPEYAISCPLCGFRVTTGRNPDLMRHVWAHDHVKGKDAFQCVGVPELNSDNEPTGRRLYMCGQTFSRKDALNRHLRKSKRGCQGEVKEIVNFRKRQLEQELATQA